MKELLKFCNCRHLRSRWRFCPLIMIPLQGSSRLFYYSINIGFIQWIYLNQSCAIFGSPQSSSLQKKFGLVNPHILWWSKYHTYSNVLWCHFHLVLSNEVQSCVVEVFGGCVMMTNGCELVSDTDEDKTLIKNVLFCIFDNQEGPMIVYQVCSRLCYVLVTTELSWWFYAMLYCILPCLVG